jgi:hypothetical protein
MANSELIQRGTAASTFKYVGKTSSPFLPYNTIIEYEAQLVVEDITLVWMSRINMRNLYINGELIHHNFWGSKLELHLNSLKLHMSFTLWEEEGDNYMEIDLLPEIWYHEEFKQRALVVVAGTRGDMVIAQEIKSALQLDKNIAVKVVGYGASDYALSTNVQQAYMEYNGSLLTACKVASTNSVVKEKIVEALEEYKPHIAITTTLDTVSARTISDQGFPVNAVVGVPIRTDGKINAVGIMETLFMQAQEQLLPELQLMANLPTNMTPSAGKNEGVSLGCQIKAHKPLTNEVIRTWLLGKDRTRIVFVSFSRFMTAKMSVLIQEMFEDAFLILDFEGIDTETVCFVRGKEVAFQALFPYVERVVLHGGLNTVNEAVNAGCRVVVYPFITDQGTYATCLTQVVVPVVKRFELIVSAFERATVGRVPEVTQLYYAARLKRNLRRKKAFSVLRWLPEAADMIYARLDSHKQYFLDRLEKRADSLIVKPVWKKDQVASSLIGKVVKVISSFQPQAAVSGETLMSSYCRLHHDVDRDWTSIIEPIGSEIVNYLGNPELWLKMHTWMSQYVDLKETYKWLCGKNSALQIYYDYLYDSKIKPVRMQKVVSLEILLSYLYDKDRVVTPEFFKLYKFFMASDGRLDAHKVLLFIEQLCRYRRAGIKTVLIHTLEQVCNAVFIVYSSLQLAQGVLHLDLMAYEVGNMITYLVDPKSDRIIRVGLNVLEKKQQLWYWNGKYEPSYRNVKGEVVRNGVVTVKGYELDKCYRDSPVSLGMLKPIKRHYREAFFMKQSCLMNWDEDTSTLCECGRIKLDGRNCHIKTLKIFPPLPDYIFPS